MNAELKPLLDLLEGKHGWVATAVSWLLAIQTALKFVNAHLQAALTAKMVDIATSGDQLDIDWFDAILQKKTYRLIAFLLDLILRLKLPTHAEFTRLLQTKKTA